MTVQIAGWLSIKQKKPSIFSATANPSNYRAKCATACTKRCAANSRKPRTDQLIWLDAPPVQKGNSLPNFFSFASAYTFMATAKSQDAIPLDLNSVTSASFFFSSRRRHTTSDNFLTPVQHTSSP